MKTSRAFRSYVTLGRTFGKWFSPIISGILLSCLRILVSIGLLLDHIFFPSIRKKKITPLVIVGNPRSGTTFLHRFLIKQGLGVGAQLWQMVYPSLTLQKLIKPLLPLLEIISPARHHSTAAHKTSLTSIETDDVSLLFKYFDGFFLYGFILAFAEENLFDWFDPKKRDTTDRDFDWYENLWKRLAVAAKHDTVIPKLFSLSTNIPAFQKRFPDAKILYMVRDPLNILPSGLSLVTGVLDKRFGFWSLEKEVRDRYTNRLYNALLELLQRFHEDWSNGSIDKSKVLIVKYDRMMTQFEDLMDDIFTFTGATPTPEIIAEIKKTAASQRQYTSAHKYDLEKFGLSAEQIRSDCSFIYDTFLNTQPNEAD